MLGRQLGLRDVTFLKAMLLYMTAQGIAGSLLSALALGYALGQPLALLGGGLSDLGDRALNTGVASLLPSFVVVGVVVILARRLQKATRTQWVLGAALWSGGVWTGLGIALMGGFTSDPSLERLVSTYVLAGLCSGAIVGLYASLVASRPLGAPSQQ